MPKTLACDGQDVSRRDRRTRFGVSLPRALAEEFDELVERMGYATRSKAIHDAISAFIVENKRLDKGYAAGALTCLYYRDVKGLIERIDELHCRYASIIPSSLQIALGPRKCLRVFIVRGPSNTIHRLARELQTKRGIRRMKIAIVA